ncbi:uncharacterized protein B0H64DRAFT_395674, partial [Chaetomium fimeti]
MGASCVGSCFSGDLIILLFLLRRSIDAFDGVTPHTTFPACFVQARSLLFDLRSNHATRWLSRFPLESHKQRRLMYCMIPFEIRLGL